MNRPKKSAILSDLNLFLKSYYAEPLEKAGFVHRENVYFDWYKAKNGLLYEVHIPIHGPTYPFVILEPGFSILPLFVWEELSPRMQLNENYWWLTPYGGDRFIRIHTEDKKSLQLFERRIGSLSRKSYRRPGIISGLPCGCNLLSLDSELRGAEAISEIALPVMSRVNSIEDIYNLNLELRILYKGLETKKEFIDYLCNNQNGGMGELFSIAFADECIAVRDEKMYPFVLASLEKTQERCQRALGSGAGWAKKNLRYFEFENQRTSLLIQVLQTEDYKLWENSIAIEQERMMHQLKQKIPEILL